MKFSVIIPSFGQAKYLRDAITSVLTQTYTDFELIVVDDGSTDGSLKIAKEFNITVIQQINKGLAAARNAGIMNAKGEYIFFLDADDMLMPEALSIIAGETISYPDVITPSIRCIDENGKVQDVILLKDHSFDDFKEGNRLAYCSAIKHLALLEVGGYSTRYDSLGGWEDLALWYDFMKRGKKFITIQKPLVLYRVKENSMWKDAEKNKVALWDQLNKDFPETISHRKV